MEHLVGTIELGEFADWDIFADLQQHSSSLPFEDEADNWELIDPFVSGTEDRTFPEASLRTRSGGLAVPQQHRHVPQSVQNSLKRGGKPVPTSKRQKPTSFDPQPRKSMQTDIQMTHSQPTVATSMHAVRPPQGPQLSRPAVQSQSRGLPMDLQKRWILFVQMIGNLSSFWQMYSESEAFETHCITLIEIFEASTDHFKIRWNFAVDRPFAYRVQTVLG